MADEQTPQSDLIDDAIRQAERQLEEKLQALRMSALGEAGGTFDAPADDVATLRPTGSATTPETDETVQHDASSTWREGGGDDLTFVPVGDDVPSAGVSDLFVPEDAEAEVETETEIEQPVAEHDEREEAPSQLAESAAALRESLSATVTDLTPVWDEDESSTAAATAPPMPTTRRASEPLPADRPEPVHSSWTDGGRARRDAAPQRVTTLPSEDEMQFWAHTRTALRNLQQLTDGLPTQVVGGVSTEVARLLHEELSRTEQALRAVQQSTEQELPRLSDRVQQSIEHAIAAPSNAIRQVRDEIPEQLDRAVRATHDNVRDELDRSTAAIHGAVQQDIVQLEQSIASNVTRMAQGTTDAIERVEQDVDVLGETVVRVERGVHAEFDRFEAQLRGAIERVEQNLRDELVAPTETLRKLDDELPARFGRVERALVDQLQQGQREVSQVLTGLVEADRAALDRLAAIGSTLDEDRARRTEDLEVVVDTVTTGWEALAGAIASLFQQAEENSRRLAAIEQRFTQIRDLEDAVERTLNEFQRHMRDLKPSPIVVTVSHDEAEVRNATRAGWTASDPSA